VYDNAARVNTVRSWQGAMCAEHPRPVLCKWQEVARRDSCSQMLRPRPPASQRPDKL